MRATHPNHHHNHNHQASQKRSSASIFSCAFFRHCTDSPLSPNTPYSSPPHFSSSLPLPPPLPPPQVTSRILSSATHSAPPPTLPHHPAKPSDSESSSSSTSQSFTQWRFPSTFPHPPPEHSSPMLPSPTAAGKQGFQFPDLIELYHMAELHFASGSDSDRVAALQMLEQSLVPNPPSDAVPESGASVVVPAVVVDEVLQHMSQKVSAKSATKVLLALCLAEGNRRVAVECGAPLRVVDALPDLEGSVAERALAALELMCTIPEGAAEVRAHALAVPMLVATMGRMEGRGREYAISVLTAVYGGGDEDHQVWEAAPPEEVARAVVLAMQQGDCSARGKRKGSQLLKVLQENGRVDLTQ
ncbi:U-box domain-containing protein 26-like [Chenopodium quinoa]|uniref:U-box domain-containing protein n=1 Tax=Chenopodium quinoa TaxID=63459 RepID=A0A803LBR8_CHEQI|nr:U-box domain-containing protein 26-like [Chenopodium quinoa]